MMQGCIVIEQNAAKNPFISAKNRKARVEFTEAYRNSTVEHWGRILWKEESKLNLKLSGGKRNVRKPVRK